MIREFHIEGYGCIRDATVRLTPIHALIGPNDSGKSMVLRALAGFVNQIGADLSPGVPPRCSAAPTTTLTADFDPPPYSDGSGARVAYDHAAKSWTFSALNRSGAVVADGGRETRSFQSIGRAQIVRLDADELKQSSRLLTEQEVASFPQGRGRELAGVYDAILGRGDETFRKISADVQEHFRTVANVRLEAVSSGAKSIGVKLTDGTLVDASRMSEGLLYYLAFAAIREVNNAKLLLVEEPENGLHPARIAEVMRLLRELSAQGTQVVIATHSPLVVNELQPDEVSIVTRTPSAGTKVTAIAETPRFKERSAVYALGELWLSYANGVDEAPLLNGTESER